MSCKSSLPALIDVIDSWVCRQSNILPRRSEKHSSGFIAPLDALEQVDTRELLGIHRQEGEGMPQRAARRKSVSNITHLLLVKWTLWKMTRWSPSQGRKRKKKERASQKFRGETNKLIRPLEIVARSVGDKAVLAQ